MSAHCWSRRRRLKYLRPYLRYLDRHPDRALWLPARNALLHHEGVTRRPVEYLPLGEFRRAVVYQVTDRVTS